MVIQHAHNPIYIQINPHTYTARNMQMEACSLWFTYCVGAEICELLAGPAASQDYISGAGGEDQPAAA